MDYKKACLMLAVLALLFALIAFSFANNINDNVNIFQVVVNNTNLAPTIEPSVPGTGERVFGVTYWANSSPLQVFIYGHAASVSSTDEIHLFINGTKVVDTSGRPLGGAESANRTIVAIIPKGANYSAEGFNLHHYEWREYPILSGRNGTLSVNQTFITSGSSFNATYDAYGSSKVNKSGDTMTGKLGFNNSNPLVPIHVGENSVSSIDAQILISRNVNDTVSGNGHAFSDSSNLNRSGVIGYNSYDAYVNITGNKTYEHYAAFQAATQYNNPNYTNKLYGFVNTPTIINNTVNNSYGFYNFDAQGAGAIINNYGLYIDNLTRGTNNYAIWSDGSEKSFINGTTDFGTTMNVNVTQKAVGINTTNPQQFSTNTKFLVYGGYTGAVAPSGLPYSLFVGRQDFTTGFFLGEYGSSSSPNLQFSNNNGNAVANLSNSGNFDSVSITTTGVNNGNYPNNSINDSILRNYTSHIKTTFFTRDISLASGTQTVTGCGFKPSYISVLASNVALTNMSSSGADDGITAWAFFNNNPTIFNSQSLTSGASTYLQKDGSNIYLGKVTSWNDDGFVYTWTKVGTTTTGTATMAVTCYR